MKCKTSMTMTDYRENIDRWQTLAASHNVLLSSGRPLPISFWKTFLGLSRKVHLDLYNGTHRVRSGLVMSYVTKSIYFANCIEEGRFIEIVRQSVPLYEEDTRT